MIAANKRHTYNIPQEGKNIMGLDQYLYAEMYTSPAEWRGEKVNETYSKLYKLPKIKKNFAKFLEKQAVSSYRIKRSKK